MHSRTLPRGKGWGLHEISAARPSIAILFTIIVLLVKGYQIQTETLPPCAPGQPSHLHTRGHRPRVYAQPLWVALSRPSNPFAPTTRLDSTQWLARHYMRRISRRQWIVGHRRNDLPPPAGADRPRPHRLSDPLLVRDRVLCLPINTEKYGSHGQSIWMQLGLNRLSRLLILQILHLW